MKNFILLILFIFLTLPCLAEEVLYLDKKWDKEASRILYDYALKKVNMSSKQAYEAFGYKLEDVRAVFYDLNSDGIGEVIGYINAPSSWCREGMTLFILQKVNNNYNDDLGYFNFYPEKGIRILNTKTDGYYDFERYFTKINFLKDSNEPLTYTYNFHSVAKYNKKYKSLEELFKELGLSESSGRYNVVNSAGYLGKYQMGGSALTDAGYYKLNPNGKENDWLGTFTGKDNVNSKEDFLNNPYAQENAIREFTKKQWGYLKNNGSTKSVGSKINGIEITPSGLLAAAHLVGQGGVGSYVSSNGKNIPKDGNGVSIEKYLKQFAGYDVSEISDSNYYSPRFPETNEEKVDQILNKTSNMIQDVTKKVNPPTQTIPDNVINETPIQPPLSEEEWRKRLRRKRMGLW